jgi:hypothetical protein
MSEKIQTIDRSDLKAISGGVDFGSGEANAYVECRNRATENFNSKVQQQQARWWDYNPGALAGFAKDLQAQDAKCLAQNPIRGRRPGDLDI